jgi:hypothetical protein
LTAHPLLLVEQSLTRTTSGLGRANMLSMLRSREHAVFVPCVEFPSLFLSSSKSELD